MNNIYFRCVSPDCSEFTALFFYGDIIPSKPSCSVCKKQYEKVVIEEDLSNEKN